MIRQKMIFTGLIAAIVLIGCATTSQTEAEQNDPWQGWNKGVQSFNDGFDKNLLKPVAKGYLDVTNTAIDDGVTNFFSNINDIGVTINDLLQFKLLQSGMDFSRFMINTTTGVGGILDWASKLDLPKHDEDFGQTLGFWGIPSGPYLVLPFFGPSSPRDTVGLIGDALMDPITYVSIFGGFAGSATSLGTSALDVTDHRAGVMATEKVLDEATGDDHYDFLRNSYQQHREYLIYDGNPPDELDPLDTDESGRSNSDNTGDSTQTEGKKGGGLDGK